MRYLHSEIETLDRIKVLRSLRAGEFDALIGINLLREGLDLPEVSLVAILDADKEGFLRSTTSLIQTMGRAARHINGRAILYADVITGSMRAAIDETNRRRAAQQRYNEENNITPQSIIKPLDPDLVRIYEGDYYELPAVAEEIKEYSSAEELELEIQRLEKEMREAAKDFEFEKAAALRDQVKKLKKTAMEFLLTSRVILMIQLLNPTTSLSGIVALPGDKSISHRYAMLAAIAEGDLGDRAFCGQPRLPQYSRMPAFAGSRNSGSRRNGYRSMGAD